MTRSTGALVGALVLLALGVAGCAGYTGTPAQKMREWVSNSGYPSDDQQIEQDLSSLQAGLRTHELKQLHTACDAFVIDADTLYDELPSPDTAATNELATGLSDFASAGIACSRSPSFISGTFLGYQSFLKKGEASYSSARRRIAAVEAS